MRTSPTHVALVLGALVALPAAPGCTSLITPHQTYAPLLDHAGQLDVSVRGGAGVPGGAGVGLNLAYAPVDHFELVGGGDVNVGSATNHFAGHFGVGTFVRDDTFRLEAIVGLYGGYAEGSATRFSDMTESYSLGARYLMPYGQVMAGYERGHFEIAGGLRASGFLGDVELTPIAPSMPHPTPQVGYERAYLEPLVTVRIPIDWFRIDFQTGFPIVVGGDVSPADLAPESEVLWYFAVGVGFQIDTLEPEPEPEPIPVYAPAPPQPQVIIVPGPAPDAPPGYDEPSYVVPQESPPPPAPQPAPAPEPAPY